MDQSDTDTKTSEMSDCSYSDYITASQNVYCQISKFKPQAWEGNGDTNAGDTAT